MTTTSDLTRPTDATDAEPTSADPTVPGTATRGDPGAARQTPSGRSRSGRTRSGRSRTRPGRSRPGRDATGHPAPEVPHVLTARAVTGVAVLGLATFFAITTELMPVGLLSTMSADLGVDQGRMGLVVTVYALAVALLALPLTFLTARLPRKAVLVATLVGYTLSNVLVATAPSFEVVCAGRVVGGVAHALFFSVASAYATRIVPPRLAGRAIAFVYSGSSLGFVVGVPLATMVGDHLGWRSAAGMVAVASAGLALVALGALPAVRGEASPHLGSVRSWARTGLLAVVLADLLLFAGHYVVYTYVGPYLVGAGLAEGETGPALLLLGATGIVGLLVAGAFVDRAPRVTLLVAVAAMTVALGGLPLVHGSLVGTFVVAGLWVAANGTTGTLFMAAAIRTGGVSPEIAGALVNGASNVGIAGGAAVGAQVLGVADLGALPAVAAVLVAAGFVTVLVARRGFPALGHAQETLSTSNLRTITSGIEVVTSSVPVVGTRTGSVPLPRG